MVVGEIVELQHLRRDLQGRDGGVAADRHVLDHVRAD